MATRTVGGITKSEPLIIFPSLNDLISSTRIVAIHSNQYVTSTPQSNKKRRN